jgi:hypothetical protein
MPTGHYLESYFSSVTGPQRSMNPTQSRRTSRVQDANRRPGQRLRDKAAGRWLSFGLSVLDKISKKVVGRTGFEPVTSSVSECRHSATSRDFSVMTWAYARWRSSGYLAVSCAYPRSPRHSRAVVGPSLGIMDLLIRRHGRIVQDRPSRSVRWADIP